MIKRYLQTFCFALAVALSLSVVVVPMVFAQSADDVCQGVAAAGASCDAGDSTVNGVIRLVVNAFSSVIGVVAVVMIMIGGFKYVTSSGDPGNVKSAKDTILFAIVGLIVVALAQIIVRFVLGRST